MGWPNISFLTTKQQTGFGTFRMDRIKEVEFFCKLWCVHVSWSKCTKFVAYCCLLGRAGIEHGLDKRHTESMLWVMRPGAQSNSVALTNSWACQLIEFRKYLSWYWLQDANPTAFAMFVGCQRAGFEPDSGGTVEARYGLQHPNPVEGSSKDIGT